MRVKKYKRIGKHHANNCEDSVGSYKIGQSRELIVVCDGCSMGDKSHYVSELIQKILREISKEEDYREYVSDYNMDMNELLRSVCNSLFKRVKKIYQLTGSHKYDYLSTVLILIVDYKSLEYSYMVSGDGVVWIDDQFEIYDQNNQPNYIGYHLDIEFEKWFSSEVVTRNGDFSKSVAVSTDGILTFSNGNDEFVTDNELNQLMRRLMSYSEIENELEIQNIIDELATLKDISTTDDIAICKLEIES